MTTEAPGVAELRAERNALQQQVDDLTKILIREGDVSGAYERRLAEAVRERDEARAELAKFKAMDFKALDDCMKQRDEALAEVERLRRKESASEVRERLWPETVAERQREAFASKVEDADDGVPLQCLADAIRATPLVTEGDK